MDNYKEDLRCKLENSDYETGLKKVLWKTLEKNLLKYEMTFICILIATLLVYLITKNSWISWIVKLLILVVCVMPYYFKNKCNRFARLHLDTKENIIDGLGSYINIPTTLLKKLDEMPHAYTEIVYVSVINKKIVISFTREIEPCLEVKTEYLINALVKMASWDEVQMNYLGGFYNAFISKDNSSSSSCNNS